MKKILILGCGAAQIDMINKCHERGYEVIGCSYTNHDPGIPLLDHFEQTDIKDVDGVIEVAKKYAVDVIYSAGSDLAIPTVMIASEKMGLPHFISSETALNCHAKHRMRTELGQDFAGNASFVVCQTLEEAKDFAGFPGMMKPVDSQGQRGCFRVDSVEDICSHFEDSVSYSKEGKVIIESFIDGPEISVNAYFQDGEMRFALVSDRHVFEDLPGGIIKEHLVPSSFADSAAKKETVDLVRRVAEKLHIENGPAYYQIKINPENHPILLEVAPRFDGCHMWNLIYHYCKVDLMDAALAHLLEGKEVLTESVEFPDEEYKLEFTSAATGSVFDRSNYDVSKAEYLFWYYETGETVRKLNGYMEKGGYQIYKTGNTVSSK